MAVSTLSRKQTTTPALPPRMPQVNAFGVDLGIPGQAPAGPMNFNDPNSIMALLQSSQNDANLANALRYNQGLGVLSGGMNQAGGFIQQALTDTAGLGAGARRRVHQNLQRDLGGTEQNLISRGLGNTTVRNTMLAGDKRRAEESMLDIDESQAAQRAALQLQLANNARWGAGSIADFIGARNDMAPDVGLYAGLVQRAEAENPSPTTPPPRRRVIRNMTGSIDRANQLKVSSGLF